MNTQSPCACAACAGPAADAGPRERPRYFPRQLLTPADMTQEQQYFRDKLRRHNRMMHGWGVVCGALVCPVPAPALAGGVLPWKVQVSEGYVLGPYGDEILIDKVTPVDLHAGTGQGAEDDPWCSPVYTPPPAGGGTCYVAVQYTETQARPVRVQPVGCGCDTSQCEYSRVRDGFTFGVLTTLPKSHTEDPPAPDVNQLLKGGVAGCPQCPADPWVVLAAVDYDADGTVTKIDNCTNRRMALSLGGFWYRCAYQGVVISKWDPNPLVLTPGTKQDVTLTGSNIGPATKVDLGPGFTVTPPQVSGTGDAMTLKATITPAKDLAAGAYKLRVINPDCSIAPPIEVAIKVPPST